MRFEEVLWLCEENLVELGVILQVLDEDQGFLDKGLRVLEEVRKHKQPVSLIVALL